MNKFFTSLMLAVMLLSSTIVAKENTTEIKNLEQTLEKYKELTLKLDMAGTLEYNYPAVFKIMPKEMLLKQAEMVKESGKMPKIKTFTYTIVKPLKSFDKGLYALVNYSTTMEMNIMPPVDKSDKEAYAKVQSMLDDPEKLKSFKSFTLKMLRMQLGKEAKIESEEKSMLVKIEKPSLFIAINEENKGWKFVEPNPMMLSQLKPLLPKQIVENEKEIFNVKTLTKKEQMAEMRKMLGAGAQK